MPRLQQQEISRRSSGDKMLADRASPRLMKGIPRTLRLAVPLCDCVGESID